MRTIEKLDPTKPDDFTVENAKRVFLEEFSTDMSNETKSFNLDDVLQLTSAAIELAYKFGKIHECTIRQKNNATKL